MTWSKCPNPNLFNTPRTSGTTSGYKVCAGLLCITQYENCEQRPAQRAPCLCSTSNIPPSLLLWPLNCNYSIPSKISAHFCLPSTLLFNPSYCQLATRGHLYDSRSSLFQGRINFIAFLNEESTTYNFGSRILQKPSLFQSKTQWLPFNSPFDRAFIFERYAVSLCADFRRNYAALTF